MRQPYKYLYGRCLLVLILWSVSFTFPSELIAQTLTPTDDAYVLQGGNADNNYGSATDLQVKESSSFARYSYLKFDLSSISSITSAKLRLYGGHASLTRTLYSKAASNDWEESTITWNNKPAPGNTLAQTSVATKDWYEWDITSYLQGKEGQQVSIVMVSSSSAEAFFNSKENSSNQPELVIEGQQDTEAPSVPADLVITDTSPYSISLSWSAATDNVGVDGYKLYLDNTFVSETSDTTYQFSELTPSTSYELGVSAVDLSGNESDKATTTATTEEGTADNEAPTTPANLQASATTSSATLTWEASTDNIGVAGYRIFQDGSPIAEVETLSYEATDLSSGTPYLFEVVAFDLAGNTSEPAEVSVTTEFPSPDDSRISLFDFYSVHVGRDSNPSKSFAGLKDMGAGYVRLFADIQDWANPTNSKNDSYAFDQAIAFKNEGFKVIMELNANNGIMPASYDEAKAYFDWVQQQPGLNDAVDAWEILNEVNLEKYWQGTAEEYVDLVLKAAWNSFKPNDETVLGGSFTLFQDGSFGSTALTQRLVDAGYLDYCDYANLHPYATSFNELKRFTDEVLSIYGDKPVIIGEWNYKDGSFSSDELLEEALNQARDYFASKPTIKTFTFYRHIASTSEGDYPGLVVNGPEYTPELPFYNMYKSWPKTPSVDNIPPSVNLSLPEDGSSYTSGSQVTLEAGASDPDGDIAEVSFYYNGDQLIGTDSVGSDGWSIVWEDVPPGTFVLSVLAKDDGGAVSGDYGSTITVEANTQGKMININFIGTGSSLDQDEVAGAVPSSFWNNSGNNATTSGLLDENGDNTGAVVSNSLPSNYKTADPATEPDYKLMRGYIADFSGNTKKVSVTDLPPVLADSTYDVYVYWGNQDGDNDYARYAIGEQAFFIRDNTNTWNGVHTLSNASEAEQSVTGANFVVFKGISGSQFELNVRAFGTFRAGVSGIQIVRSDVSPQLGQVNISSPEEGTSYEDGDDIALTATTSGFGTPVASVSFYANGTTLIGTDTTGTDTWNVDWEAVPAGIYSVTAVATNDEGVAVISFPIQLNVLGEAGDVISINFKGNGPELSANEVAGEVPAANWNNANYNTSPLLKDADGNNTGATVSTNIPSAYTSGDGTSNSDYRMMKGFIANFSNGTKTITVENLPENFGSAVYDVYVYASNLNNTEVSLGMEINEDTYFLKDKTATWDGSHDRSEARSQAEAKPGPNYVLFEGVTGTSFTVNVTSYLSGSGRIGISGMQIVKSNRATSSVLSPATGEVFTLGETLTLEAEPGNFPDSAAAQKVAFYYDDDQLIGEDTDGSDGWSIDWEIPQARSYSIYSVASSDSLEGKSLPVNIRVAPADPANVISVNFKGTASLLDPTDTAGAAPVAYWNNTLNNDTTLQLRNGAGDTTEAFVINTLPANYASFDSESDADFKMMKGYVANFDGGVKEVTVGNLPEAFVRNGYSVLVYWGNKDTDNDVVAYTIDTLTYYLRDGNERWDGLHNRSLASTEGVAKNGANYVLFNNLSDSSFTMQVQSFNTFRGGISGLQVIAAVPSDTTPPSIMVTESVTADNDPGLCAATVALDSATATDESGIASLTAVRDDSLSLTDPYPVGTTLITWTATDNAGNVASAEQQVTVKDAEAPVITLADTAATLWPPNREYHTFMVDSLVSSVTDNCQGTLAAGDVSIRAVTSDEPMPLRPGRSVGEDIVIAEGCRQVDLMAERDGRGNGRVYTIYLVARDSAGNESEAVYKVYVPHDQSREAVEDEAAYTVAGACGQDSRVAGPPQKGSVAGEMPGASTGDASISLYPNPASEVLTLTIPAEENGEAQVVIRRATGQVLKERSVTLSAGMNTLNLPLQELSDGLYLVEVRTRQKTTVHKLLIRQ